MRILNFSIILFKIKLKSFLPEGIVAVKLSKLSHKYALWNISLKENHIARKCYKFSHSSLIKNSLEVCCEWAVGDAVRQQAQHQPQRYLGRAWSARLGIPNLGIHYLVHYALHVS